VRPTTLTTAREAVLGAFSRRLGTVLLLLLGSVLVGLGIAVAVVTVVVVTA